MGGEELEELVEERRFRSLVPALVALVMKEICERHEVYLLTQAELQGVEGLKIIRRLPDTFRAGGRALIIRRAGSTAPAPRSGSS
ncbi:MAG: hypothetical protein DRJ67_07430 [Thermoprotei archaeon]|nr:MAG: hypothetical protein DRJ67_07430 [Thermoprotei archaeon]